MRGKRPLGRPKIRRRDYAMKDKTIWEEVQIDMVYRYNKEEWRKVCDAGDGP